MAKYEYMKISLDILPEEIISQYNLCQLASNGWVYLDIGKVMPGLKQAGRISNDRIQIHLPNFGYPPVARTPSLWKNATKDIFFSLVVDDFGAKYVDKETADHLIQALQKLYTISIDWTAPLYCGITINWDYEKRACDISMPTYTQEALNKFQHTSPYLPQDASHAWNQPIYGAAVQYSDQHKDYLLLPPKSINLLQQIIGTLLYYAITVNPTMLIAIGTIASQQSKATQKTRDATVWILNYAASHHNTTIHYSISDMVLHLHRDASYLSEPGACSRVGGR